MTLDASQLSLDLIREKARGSLYFFAKGVLGYNWLNPRIHGPVCRALMDLSKPRKVFVLPRGWLKTTICTIAEPIWASVHNPNLRTLIVQNNANNAMKKLKIIREQFEQNALLRALYPNVLPTSKSTWSATSLTLNRTESYGEGTFDCLGVGGQAVSRHYNRIIEDDTVAPAFDELGEESLAPSTEDVEKAIGLHKLLEPLLDDPPLDLEGRIEPTLTIVGTRWYEKDLIQYVIDNQPEYEIITRACRENEEGKPDARGMVTYPERFDEEVLRNRERALGPYMFNCLYLNSPMRTGDMVFQEKWIKYYQTIPPRQSLVVWTTVDAATDPELSKSKDLDYSTVVTCGKDLVSGDIFVLDYFRERCDPGTHLKAMLEHAERWNPLLIGYEDIAYQKSINYWARELMRKNNRFHLLQPISRSGHGAKSKAVHIMGLQPLFANGVIYLRTWMKEMVSELLTFPMGGHDDLIDTLAMQTQLWLNTRSKRDQKPKGHDPMSFAAALEDFKAKQHSDGLVFDPLNAVSERAV